MLKENASENIAKTTIAMLKKRLPAALKSIIKCFSKTSLNSYSEFIFFSFSQVVMQCKFFVAIPQMLAVNFKTTNQVIK